MKAHAEEDEMRFWIRYPNAQPSGTVLWQKRKTILRRYLGQLELFERRPVETVIIRTDSARAGPAGMLQGGREEENLPC